jgi:simple sugar transport system substrate-binding protein
MSADALTAIKDGKMAFAVDQQQFAQGYMSVVLLFLNVTNAHELGGGLPIYTGPGFVTADNVDVVMELVAAGTR